MKDAKRANNSCFETANEAISGKGRISGPKKYPLMPLYDVTISYITAKIKKVQKITLTMICAWLAKAGFDKTVTTINAKNTEINIEGTLTSGNKSTVP
jgi:hypothetical protein